MSINFYFGNKIDVLSKKLIDTIDTQKDYNNPFSSPMIIVPNINVLKWLQMQIAQDKSICINLEFKFLENGLTKILSRLGSVKENDYLFLGHKENHLQFQIMILLEIFNNETDKLKIINDYLGNKNNPDYPKRIWQLSDKLTKYFREYEYQRSDMLSKWKINSEIPLSEMEKCQKEIYKNIFFDDGIINKINKFYERKILTLPVFTDLILSKLKENKNNIIKKQLYIFGFSQISQFHYKLLFELSNYYNINIFQLIFLSEFWKNPKKEWQFIDSIIPENKIEIKSPDYEDDLIKIWGKPSRENTYLLRNLLKQNEKTKDIKYEWLINEKQNNNKIPSVLEILQNNISQNSLFEQNNIKIDQDKSIQIIGCPGIYREVETVFNNIIFNMQNDESLKLTDFAILVPDIKKYKPIIKSIFLTNSIDKSNTGEYLNPVIPFNLSDTTASQDSNFADALLTLLSIPDGNFTRKEIFELILNPIFLSSQKINRDDVTKWLNWTKELNIFRGYDFDKINVFSWQQGLIRLRFGRIMDSTINYENKNFLSFENIVPYSDLESNEILKLDKFIGIMESLLTKLKNLTNKKLSQAGWKIEIFSLINEFLRIPEDDKEENYVLNQLMIDFDKLEIFDVITNLTKKNELPLSYIIEFIKTNLENIPSSIGHYLTDGVTISSLVPLRPIPFKIVYLMGLGEGEFPGFADNSTLDLRNCDQKIGDISLPEANKYLFLETLTSAREKLYISYVSYDIQKDEEITSSSVVNQLIDYLEKKIINKEFKIIKLPLKGYNKLYLESQQDITDIFNNYSYKDRIISIYQNKEKIENLDNNFFENEFDKSKNIFLENIEKINSDNNDIIKVSIKELTGFLKNPIEAQIKRHLKIYDNDEEDQSNIEDEPFFSKFPFDYNFIITSLEKYIYEYNNIDYKKFINDYYDFCLLQSKTPEKDFAVIDKKNFSKIIEERILGKNNNGLKDFLTKTNNMNFLKNIIVGNINIDTKSDLVFPSLKFNMNNQIIEISGSIKNIWKDTDLIQTLILSNSSSSGSQNNIKLSKYVFEPFLFYLIMLCGEEKNNDNINSNDFINNSKFLINISYNTKNDKIFEHFFYKIDKEQAINYLKELINNFLFLKEYDLLPFDIISELIKDKIIDEKKINKKSIEEKIDNQNEFFIEKKMNIIDIINPVVPYNSYSKIKSRFELLYKFEKGVKDD